MSVHWSLCLRLLLEEAQGTDYDYRRMLLEIICYFFLVKDKYWFYPRLSSLRFLVTQVVWVWVLSHGMGL